VLFLFKLCHISHNIIKLLNGIKDEVYYYESLYTNLQLLKIFQITKILQNKFQKFISALQKFSDFHRANLINDLT